MSVLVIIPTYNEIENIDRIIPAVIQQDHFDVLIVDDNSPDGTARRVKQLQEKYKNRLFLIEREGKLGLGTAYIRGFKFGLNKGYTFMCEMDADFSHDPGDLPRLVESCRNSADVTVGSRYVRGGGLKNWPKNRVFISKGGALYVWLITFMPVRDPTAGFVCYRANFLSSIELDKVQFSGYAFQIEMKYIAWKLGFKIREVPIIFKERELGRSKMNISIIKEAVTGVLKLRFRNIRSYYARS